MPPRQLSPSSRGRWCTRQRTQSEAGIWNFRPLHRPFPLSSSNITQQAKSGQWRQIGVDVWVQREKQTKLRLESMAKIINKNSSHCLLRWVCILIKFLFNKISVINKFVEIIVQWNPTYLSPTTSTTNHSCYQFISIHYFFFFFFAGIFKKQIQDIESLLWQMPQNMSLTVIKFSFIEHNHNTTVITNQIKNNSLMCSDCV